MKQAVPMVERITKVERALAAVRACVNSGAPLVFSMGLGAEQVWRRVRNPYGEAPARPLHLYAEVFWTLRLDAATVEAVVAAYPGLAGPQGNYEALFSVDPAAERQALIALGDRSHHNLFFTIRWDPKIAACVLRMGATLSLYANTKNEADAANLPVRLPELFPDAKLREYIGVSLDRTLQHLREERRKDHQHRARELIDTAVRDALNNSPELQEQKQLVAALEASICKWAAARMVCPASIDAEVFEAAKKRYEQ